MFRRLLPVLSSVLVPALVAAAPAFAREPMLAIPLHCRLGEDCFILNYMDSDPGPGAADFTCGPRSYDGHKGTDFAVPSFAAMEAGVAVRPAAPGVVTALRDGMADIGADATPPEALAGQECGNGVVISHGDGWETQYCHLKRGSIAVQRGQRVSLATVLGEVGFSGRTQFPHVHLSVRHAGVPVDPFNTDQILDCGADDGPEDDLWNEIIPYDPGAIVSLGMADRVPEFEALKAGDWQDDSLSVRADALVGWGLIAGARAGDRVEIGITRPDGSALVRAAPEIERTQAMLFRAAGKRRPDEGWPLGDYTLAVRLVREGAVLATMTRIITVTE